MARRRCAAEDLVFRVNYLGGEIPTFALNFSRPGSQVIAQCYNFLRLGRDGYRAVQQGCQDVALRLSTRIAELGPFELLTEGSELPVFAFKLRDDITNYTVFEVSRALRGYGWQVPAYTLPANLQDVSRSSALSCATASTPTWPTSSSATSSARS